MKVLVTTAPFGESSKTPLEILEALGVSHRINPMGRRLTERELIDLTLNMISQDQIRLMKRGVYLINTSRDGIVDGFAVDESVREKYFGGAALDVFEKEPSNGPLTNLEEVLLTSHMGSMSRDCRARIEFEATQEVERFIRGIAFQCPVPEPEYVMQKTMGL
jgi:D-3-phosphoglycerate dehydrogenase / 2-oxoglutarate reductase